MHTKLKTKYKKPKIYVPSINSSFSMRSLTVGEGITIEDFRLSEPGFSAATSQNKGKCWVLNQKWIAVLTMKHKGYMNKWNLLYNAPKQILTWNKIFYKMCLEWHLQCINKKMQLGCKSNPTLFRTFKSICITIIILRS